MFAQFGLSLWDKMQLVERQIRVKDKNLDKLCFSSKNLYNYANYCIRRRFINSGRFLSAYSLIKIFTRINQVDYRALPAKCSQQIILKLEKNWKSFFRAIKEYSKNPNKFKARPKLPNYKHKIKGRNLLILDYQQAKLKDNHIYFPKALNIEPIKTSVSNLRQVRIIPNSTCFVIEIVYEVKERKNDLIPNTHISIDLGLSNLATCFNDTDNSSFIINGRPLKSINAYYNKLLAKAKSFIGIGTSNRIKRITHKRNMKVQDYLHKTSRYIVNCALKNKISTIVIGLNKGWKQNIGIGKRNNQNFVSIPYDTLINQIKYKSQLEGIEVFIVNESHTSKCDFLAGEEVKHHEKYLGSRVKRGLFKSSTGKVINADLNGALNILKKAFPNALADGIKGLRFSPVKVNLTNLHLIA
jgi:putative transposase